MAERKQQENRIGGNAKETREVNVGQPGMVKFRKLAECSQDRRILD
jgi:hypothetical protein